MITFLGFGKTQSEAIGGSTHNPDSFRNRLDRELASKPKPTIEPKVEQTLKKWAIADFKSSGISDAMIALNAKLIEGDAAVDILSEWAIAEAQGNGTVAVNWKSKSILRCNEFAASGIWCAWGSTIDGDRGEVAYVKPFKPRYDFSKGNPKPIKYETPAKCEALPILSFVSWGMGLTIAKKHNLEKEYVERLWKEQQASIEGVPGFSEACRGGRYREAFDLLWAVRNQSGDGSVEPGRADRGRIEGFVQEVDRGFWRWWQSINGAIILTEGWKKAASLIEQGYPAICLRGVANWHRKGETELFPILREFATEGRVIRIVFDQDEKPTTIANVGAQIKQLGQILQNFGCKVFVTTWASASGKGIDDAFVKEGAEWLDQTIANSLTLDEWKKCGLKRQYFEIIRRLKTLLLTPDRDTTGDWLPELPSDIPIGSITAIAANMGSGKSFTGINQTSRRWIENGGNVLRIDPLLSLGAQGSRLSDIPHSSDYDLTSNEGYSAFCRDISARHGAAICFNSLLRIPDWFLNQPKRPLLLILDEVNQGLDYLIQGDTIASKQPEILDRFSEICFITGFNGAIISAEAEIHPRSVEMLKAFSKSDNVRYFRHKRINDPWQVTIGSGRLDGFVSQMLLDFVEGAGHGESKRFLIPTDSQASGKKIERRLAREFPGKKIVRIDSETNRGGAFAGFFDDPDQWLEENQPDFLIVSPSLKTGVSITWAGFDAVYGFFVGAIDPDGWAQMLGRYRPNVPRFVCVPQFVHTKGDEALMMPRAVDRKLTQNRAAFSNHFAIAALSETDDRKAEVLLAAQSYYADMCVLRGAQKAIARDYFISVLTEVGHAIEIQEWGVCKAEAAILSEIKVEIDREDSVKWGDSPVCDSIEDAKKILASDCSLEDEIKAKKTLRAQEFPGRDFDNAEECYWILIRDRGNIGRGAQRQAAMENLAASKELDRELVEAICSNELGMSHRLPKQHVKAHLLKQSGILQFADRGSELRNSDKRCIAIQQWAVQHAKQLRYYFGFTIAAEYTDSQGSKRHTPIDVCGKLLGAIGLKNKKVRTQGGRGNQERVYTVVIDRVRDEDQETAWKFRDLALAAARERLNQIEPIDIPVPQTHPESADRSESAQNRETQSEQDFDHSYSQDFGEDAA